MHFSTTIMMLLGVVSTASAVPVLETSHDKLSISSAPLPADRFSTSAAAYQLQTWSAPSCKTGDVLWWNAPAGFKGCTSLSNVRSVRINSYGGCNTSIHPDAGCNVKIFPGPLEETGKCYGFSDGSLIRSVYVNCT